jgi:lipopolysaccharide assembly outer membrane protein LptD (OstA)
MRRILLTVGLLALTVSTGAQTPTPNRLGLERFSSLRAERIGNVSHLTGNVMVWVGTALVTADEAFINLDTDEIEFRGNVRMKAK